MSNVLSFLRDHLCEFINKLAPDDYNTLRAWHHKAADLIEAQQREIDAISAALGTTYYMDPPDGGGVSLSAQVALMAVDAARYRWLRENRDVLLLTGFFGNGCINRTIDEVDAAIDTARLAP